jgi:hypothetical protein
MDEIDIWCCAHLFVEQHGDEAEFAVTKHLYGMVKQHNSTGEAAWERVLCAIRELQAARADQRFH